jgi:CheY-like chemotaxis protein
MRKVLLVEDNEDDVEVYRALLYYNGFDVIVAKDGPSGIDMAFSHKPAAILIDVMMPGMNGLVAAQRIHENPETAHIPIICMSAYDVSVNMVKHAGAVGLLPKPVSGDILVRTIRKYIGWHDAESPQVEGGY